MENFVESLLSAAPLDLSAAAGRGEGLAFLSRLNAFPFAGRSLLEHTQAVMDAVLQEAPVYPELVEGPPPAPFEAATMTPWWSPMPAAYVAALFLHAGLPEVTSSEEDGPAADSSRPPHALASAELARRVLREMGVPFVIRQHAAALIAHQGRPAGLLGSGAPAETYMRLACALDLGALYHLRRAELRALECHENDPAAQRLEAFRERAEGIGVFGRPHRPPLDAERVRETGFEDARELHRALNALRYFQLVARMGEQDWHVERLRLERSRPSCRLHLLVGPAGCGKSSWAQEHLAGTAIVSSDQMREELTGDPSDQGQNYLVFQRCMDRVRRLLRQGREVTFDATNCSEALRSMPVQAARWSGAEIVSYFFDVGLTDALERNRMRPRAVPEDVIRRHYRLLELPALYEADRHMVVDADGHTALYWPVKEL